MHRMVSKLASSITSSTSRKVVCSRAVCNRNYGAKAINFGVGARAAMLQGVSEVAEAVKVTMGPKTDLKSKSGFPLKIEVDTKVKAKMGGLKTPKVGVRVTCDGITATVPTGKTAATASTSASKCKVDIRIKIWKWTF